MADRPFPSRGSGHARSAVTALLLVLVVTSCSANADSNGLGREPATPQPQGRAGPQTEVRIDLGVRHQVIDGFGVSERVWEDPHIADAPAPQVPAEARAAILDALVNEAGLTRMRSILDPPPTAADAVVLTSKVAEAHVAVVDEAVGLGLTTFFAAPESLAPWMRDHPDRYVDWVMAVMLRWRELGATLPYFSPVNEPAADRAGDLPAEWYVRVVKRLGRRMRAEGLNTMLVIPDDLNPGAAYGRATAVLEDADARPFVAAVAYHLYGYSAGDVTAMRDLARRYGVPVWMTEYSAPEYGSWPGALGWATTMHEMLTRGDASAVDYLWGFFGSQQQPHTLISMQMDNGIYRSHTLEPTFFLTAQYARFVRPGCVRVSASSRSSALLTSAFSCPGGAVVVVAINAGSRVVAARFSVPGLSGEISAVRTSADEDGTPLPPTAATSSGFDATIPAGSVTTFVGQRAP